MTIPSWHEEPISRRHPRDRFDCGDDDLNIHLQRHARQNHEGGGAKTFLAIDDADGRVLGFYTLATYPIDLRTVQHCNVHQYMYIQSCDVYIINKQNHDAWLLARLL